MLGVLPGIVGSLQASEALKRNCVSFWRLSISDSSLVRRSSRSGSSSSVAEVNLLAISASSASLAERSGDICRATGSARSAMMR